VSSHSLHPDTHEAGLADSCDRCREHAEEPLLGLDETNLTNLVARLVRREDYPDTPRSLNEALALDNLRQAVEGNDKARYRLRTIIQDHKLLVDFDRWYKREVRILGLGGSAYPHSGLERR